jgi:cytochrome c-type biogenesis protein CcmH
MKRVTTRVLCPCGTCVNQTLHECTCGTAAGERKKVAAALAAGEEPEAIIESYVESFGLQILTTPEKKGYNLLGWAVPFIAAVLGLGTLTVIIRRWSLSAAPAAGAQETRPSAADPIEKRYRDRLEQELEEFRT